MKKLIALCIILTLAVLCIPTAAFPDISTISSTESITPANAPAGATAPLADKAKGTPGPLADAAAAAGRFVTTVLLPLVGTIAAGFLAKFLGSLATKAGADAETIAKLHLDAVASSAIKMVEEKTADLINKGINPTSEDKLNLAMSHVLANTKVDTAEASDAIHAALASMSGVGATGDTVIAAGRSLLSLSALTNSGSLSGVEGPLPTVPTSPSPVL